MVPAIVLVPLFNFGITSYSGNRLQKQYTTYVDKYIGHLKDNELLNFDTLYAQLKEQRMREMMQATQQMAQSAGMNY